MLLQHDHPDMILTPSHHENTEAPVIDVSGQHTASEIVFAPPRPYGRAVPETVATRQRQRIDVEQRLREFMHRPFPIAQHLAGT
jgi:hypothetical protein